MYKGKSGLKFFYFYYLINICLNISHALNKIIFIMNTFFNKNMIHALKQTT